MRSRSAFAMVAVLGLPIAMVTSPAAGGDQRVQVSSTPVLSARRVPSLVMAEARRPHLVSELEGIVGAGPPDVCVTVDSGRKRLFAHRADAPMAPASNLKLLTAQLALEILGTDHRYRTTVAGKLDAHGVVDGNLYLVGGGDPVLETRSYRAHFGSPAQPGTSLEELADRVVAAGVTRVTGSVIGDESRYDSVRNVPSWPGRFLEQHQLGPLSALEVNQSFTEFPDTFDETRLGELRASDDPPRFAASVFASLLRERGVRIDGPVGEGTRPEGVATITEIASPALDDIVAQMLSRSDNQIAELLVKEVGKEKGAGGTTAAGLAVFRARLAGLDLPTQGVVLRDGSGLDRENRLSCGLLSQLLGRSGTKSAIAKGLAVSGISGTLRDRMVSAPLKGRIHAKTGTLNDVTALSGFARTRGGPTLVFTYIANDALVSEELLEDQDHLAEALVGYAGPLRLSSLGPR